MRSFVLVMLKFTLAALFLWNIGLFSLFSNMEPGAPPPTKLDGGAADRKYLNEKVASAKAWGKKYTPELYFKDMTDIRLKEKKNDFDRNSIINVNYSLNEIHMVLSQNLMDLRLSKSYKEYDLFLQRITDARIKYEEIMEPGTAAKEAKRLARMEAPYYWRNVWLSVLAFFGSFYLKNFLLGFALIWIWWYQDRESIRINNPLSFFICVLLYPITIIGAWYRLSIYGARKYAMSIELKRRHADIFSLFSGDEISEIKKFAKSNLQIKDYRLHLDNKGLVRQHALIPIIVIVSLFIIVPKSFASPMSHKSVDIVKYQIEIKAFPDIGGSHGGYNDDNAVVSAITYHDQIFFHFSFVWQKVFTPIAKQHLGFRTNPDPVPLFNW